MITFPAFIHETNGIILVSDGVRQATFDNISQFLVAVPGYSLPDGCLGISYEDRANKLMHRRMLDGGDIQFLDGQRAPELDAIIEEMDAIMAAFVAQEHPLFGYDDLAQIKTRATMLVDTDAERERLLLITPGAGQAMVYQEKKEEAARLQELIGNGTDLAGIDQSDFPFLSSEVGITGQNLTAVADAVVTQSTNWKLVSAAIEKVRLQTKSQIEAAEDVGTVRSIFDNVNWPTSASVLSQ
ncbi:hypothetical protein [Thalassospira sp.]|uniref:hypothetical protein n=1 Tax=Thalassospira sp. TaxID=1912094 RepID=UPI001B112768|nr:hypothetical protein [Thalassospira sp.]MBO6805757.1 hypothetical protein [Thalassospira sp.]MBO6841371.1 hypothetical protein [Thalassospira sp.]